MGLWLLLVVGVFIAEIVLWIKRFLDKNKTALRPQRTNFIAEWLILVSWLVFFNIVMIGAWDRDNNLKFMIWLYLGMMALASSRMNKLIRSMQEKFIAFKKRPWIGKTCLASLYTLLFFSGTVCVLATILPQNKGFFVYDRLELQRVKKAVDGISPDAVFAARDTFNHPLTYWGHKLVMGYAGHVWSHGYDFGGVQEKLNNLYTPGSDWETITRDLKIDYIFRGPWERHHFKNHSTDWQDKLKNVSSDPLYEVYRVNK